MVYHSALAHLASVNMQSGFFETKKQGKGVEPKTKNPGGEPMTTKEKRCTGVKVLVNPVFIIAH